MILSATLGMLPCFRRTAYACTCVFLLVSVGRAEAESITSVSIVPDLDISRFASYTIESEMTGSPVSVSVEIVGVNGDGGSEWDYYVDGTPASVPVTKTMTYNTGSGKWVSESVYPDSIYPEVFFAPSNLTWENAPSDIIVRRNNYHLLHFANPFTMTGSMSFFFEVNAVPRSPVNSADLQVYLVSSGTTVNFFNSDWRTSADVELVSALHRSAVYHHEHSANSSHHLVALSTNPDGTIGSKNIDVSGDFWVILYANSPNDARGWNLKYQASDLCTSDNRWYIGSQAGWQTAVQEGCPDSHLHIARRALAHLDGVTATVTAEYGDGSSASSADTFYFAALPNLAPNPTSFTSPVPGAVYDGLVTDAIPIAWEPATDPNDGDELTYTITLLDSEGAPILPALATATGATSFSWPISTVAPGTYGLKGEVCDDAAVPLCTEFALDGTFTITKVDPVFSLSSITIASDNATSSLAKAGDTVTLSFSSTGDISATVAVTLYSGGDEVVGPVSVSNIGNDYTATYVVAESDADGTDGFSITADNLDAEYTDTTDDSYVLVDTTLPTILSVTSATADGAYKTGAEINITALFSEDVTSSGAVTVELDTGGKCDVTLSNTATGSCTYVVQDGENSSDLTVADISGTIKDAAGNVVVNFVPVSNLAATSDIVIDTIDPGTPVASPGGGTYTISQSVVLSADGASEIRYSTDGSAPSCSSGSVYSSAISVTVSAVVKAIACDAAGNTSAVAVFTYTITPAAASSDSAVFAGGRRGSMSVQNRGSTAEQTLHGAAMPTEPAQARFTDVPASHPHAESIDAAVRSKGISGVTGALFRPQRFLTRAGAVQVALSFRGIAPDGDVHRDCFPDVSTFDAAPCICYAKDARWVNGFLAGEFEGLFKPELPITREQAIALLLRAFGLNKGLITQAGEPWYVPYVNAAQRLDVLWVDTDTHMLERRVSRGSFIESAYQLHLLQTER